MCNGNTRRSIKGGRKGKREGGKKVGKEGTEISEVKLIKNFPKLITDMRPQNQDAQKTPKHIIFKLKKTKDKKKILRSEKGGKYIYRETKTRFT